MIVLSLSGFVITLAVAVVVGAVLCRWIGKKFKGGRKSAQ